MKRYRPSCIKPPSDGKGMRLHAVGVLEATPSFRSIARVPDSSHNPAIRLDTSLTDAGATSLPAFLALASAALQFPPRPNNNSDPAGQCAGSMRSRYATPSRPGSAPPCRPSACTCTPCTQPMV
ncbi:hypothetical protein D9M69_696010 [compost metagenome]